MLGSKISAVSLISNAEASGTQRSATPTNAAASPQRPSPPAPPGTGLSRPQTTDTPAGRHNMKTTGDEPPVVEFTTTIDEKSSHGDHRRTIDRNRPVDTFSDQDMVAIKRAADCFAVMGCDKEAFELYITMLKRRISRAERFKDANFWHLVIQCAYTASNAEHAEVIRNIIQAELGHPHYWPSMRTAFLMHMLLAFICNRIDDYKGVGIHLKKARANGPPFDDFIKWVFLFSDVSHHDRSLYLAVLRNLERFESEELVLGSVDPSLTTVGPRTPKRRGFLEDYILSELPQVVKFNSSCVSSCLVWCHRRLKELASKRPSTAGPWVSHPELPKPMYDLKDDLFIMLWRQWGSSSVTDAPRWIRESQGEVGISPTEMLIVVCRMIVALHFSNNPEDQVNESEADLVRRLSDACKFMLKEPRLERRKRFLAEYVWLNSVTPWLDMRPGAQRMDRLLVVEYVEETLMVRFPDIGGPTEDLQTTLSAFPSVPLRGDRSQASATGKQLSPTLASSLSSLDLTIFKKVGAKASRLRDLLLRTSSAPSSVSLGVSSDLSDSLNAMSISGGN